MAYLSAGFPILNEPIGLEGTEKSTVDQIHTDELQIACDCSPFAELRRTRIDVNFVVLLLEGAKCGLDDIFGLWTIEKKRQTPERRLGTVDNDRDLLLLLLHAQLPIFGVTK